MSTYAFIFARGGSKGLANKNIKRLAGKPLICYSIEIALQVDSIDKVFVSTDDNEIAHIANEAGAVVIERPKELALDDSPERLAWRHAVTWVNKHYGQFEYFISLPATSPLRKVEDVNAAIERFQETTSDICIAVTPASRSPFFNMVKINEKHEVELVNQPKSAVFRRQDAPIVYDITTLVYVTKPIFINKYSGLFDGMVTSIEVPKERAVDIDDIYDFYLAEAIINNQGKEDVKQ